MSTYNETRVCASGTPGTVEDLLIDGGVSNTIHTATENLGYAWDMGENQIYDLGLSI